MLGLILGLIAVWMWFVLVHSQSDTPVVVMWVLSPILVSIAFVLGATKGIIANIYNALYWFTGYVSDFERSVYKKG